MSENVKNEKAKNEKAKPTEAEFLAQRENDVRKKYKRVLEGTIQRDTEGSHAGKITVELSCAAKDCVNVRRVATSDLFQVKFCQDCTTAIRNKNRRKKVAALKAEAPPKKVKEVKVKDDEVKVKKVKVKEKTKPGTVKGTRKPRKDKNEPLSFAAANGAAHEPEAAHETEPEIDVVAS